MNASHPQLEHSHLRVNLAALDANLAHLRHRLLQAQPARPAAVCAVVKANAYGLGAPAITRRLLSQQVTQLAVYAPAQARVLVEQVELGDEATILLLAPLWQLSADDPLLPLARAGRLHVSVQALEHIDALAQLAQQHALRLPVHVHVDTGMSRAGLRPDQAAAAWSKLLNCDELGLAGLYTHLSASGEEDERFTHAQLRVLDDLLAQLRLPEGVQIHLANTDAVLRHDATLRHCVRVGLGLYGYHYVQGEHGKEVTLAPMARWVSRLVQVNHYEAGAAVGYARTHTLTRASRLGVIPVGYADGYPLALSGRGVVAIPSVPRRPQACAPVLGRVSMDQIVVDLTDLPASVTVGSEVVLYSDDPASPAALPRLAELAQSHCYELLTRIAAHVPRMYVG